MDTNPRLLALTLLSSLVVASCGGGDSSPAAVPAPPPAPPAGPTATSVQAATDTATNNANCQTGILGSFYWEIGDKTGAKVSGSISTSSASVVTSTTQMNIASASKWLYSSYVVQSRGVVAADIPFLNFTSGYSQFGTGMCTNNLGTVQDCLDSNNSAQDPNSVGVFFYDSGHMEVHAATIGLGGDDIGALKSTILDVDFGGGDPGADLYAYTQPLLAGGVFTDASTYAVFLRNILSGNLDMLAVLQNDASATPSYKVCTTPACAGPNSSSPLTASTTESWNYSLGHWVEDDPVVGDHAFSSAGALGFYPWIDSSMTYYGIVAREMGGQSDFEGFKSAQCGRLIRQAWMTGVEVTATTPTP